MSNVVDLWRARLDEATVQLGRGIDASTLADRYDVATAADIEALTNQAVREMIRADYAELTLDDFDAAAKRLEVTA